MLSEKMKIIIGETSSLMLLFIFLASGLGTKAFSYDHSATTEPLKAQYGGGMIANPEFTQTLEGWTVFGQGSMKHGTSKDGNKYIVAHDRTMSIDSVSQRVQFQKGKLYTFSAWVQISEGSESVSVVFKTGNGELVQGGKVTARNGCWSLLKGGVVANYSSPVQILFESANKVEIWVDSVSLQPFTVDQWRSHQDKSVDRERKTKVRFHVTYANGTAMEGARVSLQQTGPSFPFGCGMNNHILDNQDYQKWFASRFKYTTFTNQMKWYSTEVIQGQENYTVPDAMVKFCKENGISIRGHNIFWDNQKYQPEWVKNLSPDQLREAAEKRINSVVSRYAGQLIAWDVMNENLHFRFYEDKLGENASAEYFSKAHQLDPGTTLFMNEYNTIEYPGDDVVNPINYKNRLQDILSYPRNREIPAGIGLQGHFGAGQPNLAYMRSSLDFLGSTGFPIWLTEVDVGQDPNQAQYLEQVLREGYSHPAVKGIIMFAGPKVAGFNVTTLADEEFNNTLAGDVVDKLINEWKTQQRVEIRTDSKGSFEILLFHGGYNITIESPDTSSLTSLRYKVANDAKRSTVHVNFDI